MLWFFITGVCSNATAPSVSSINRILRNRAAERAAAEFARAAGYGLYAAGPHPYFNSGHHHASSAHHLSSGWPGPGAGGHPWVLPPLGSGMSGAASALLLPSSLSPGTAAAAAAAVASASVAGSPDHALQAADAIARGYLQGRSVNLPFSFDIITPSSINGSDYWWLAYLKKSFKIISDSMLYFQSFRLSNYMQNWKVGKEPVKNSIVWWSSRKMM